MPLFQSAGPCSNFFAQIKLKEIEGGLRCPGKSDIGPYYQGFKHRESSHILIYERYILTLNWYLDAPSCTFQSVIKVTLQCPYFVPKFGSIGIFYLGLTTR